MPGSTRTAIVANDVTRNASSRPELQASRGRGAPSQRPERRLDNGAADCGDCATDHVLKRQAFCSTPASARWSLKGQGWGACQSCHTDGLTDNVTWYFARGPRQSTSLDGSFASKDSDDQRILNWTAIFDEVADFENNTRGVSGGVGAIVSASAHRRDRRPHRHRRPGTLEPRGIGDAGGGSAKSARARQPAQAQRLGRIEKYMQTIRSPRGPSNLEAAKVAEGKTLFQSRRVPRMPRRREMDDFRRFYTPSIATNSALATTTFAVPAGFPDALLPAHDPANRTLRFAGGNVGALDQIFAPSARSIHSTSPNPAWASPKCGRT